MNNRAAPTPQGCSHPHHKGKRRVSRVTRYWYQDDDHGIKEGECCFSCYAWHILKHYPDSRVADHIRAHPQEYKNKYETKTRR